MNHQFKPGDLAMIAGAKTDAGCELIGKVVELIHKVRNREETCFDGRLWFADSGDSRGSWIVKGEGLIAVYLDGRVAPSDDCLCAEKNLMPLRGDFAPEQQKAREAEPCA